MRKLFSLIAAVLFAGSMMATEVIFTNADFAGQGTANTGSEVSATKDGVTFTYSKGYSADESLRCYAHGSLSITATATIEKINFTTTGGKNGGLDAEVTVNATSYSVDDLASQARFTEIKVTLSDGGVTPPVEPETIPTTAPAVPDKDEANVMGIYCNHYATNNANFQIAGYAGAYQTLDLNGTNVGYWTGFAWECIIDPAPNTDNAHDFSAYENIHIDVWAPAAAKVKFTAEAVAGGNYKDGQVLDLAQGWNSFDIAIANWAGNYDFANLKCFVLEQYQTPAGESFEGNPFAFANIYFWNAPAATLNTCAEVYSMAKNDAVALNDVTVTFANGKNVWVKDATASMLVYMPANATYNAGDVLSGVAGTVDIYNGVYEVKPSADQAAAITATAGEAPAPEALTAVTTADMNKYIVLENMAVEGTFAEGTQSNINLTIGEATVVLRNQFKNGFAFEAGKTYNITGVVTIYQNNPQIYFISAEEVGGVTPGETIDVVATSVRWSDATATQGWWQIYGTAGEWNFSISNISATEAPGTYTMAEDLDPDWTYLKKYDEEDEVVDSVYFVGGQVVVAISAEGVVTVVGALVGENGNTYNFNLTYKDPVAETTVNIEIPEWQVADTYFAYYGIFALAGEAANGDYVQLDLVTDGETIAGDYTETDADPYELYGSGLIVGGVQPGIFSFTIHIEEQAENGRAIVTGDILCYDNVVYHVTTLVGEGIDNVDAAVKAIKSIVNSQVVIEKAGKTFNMNGAVVR